MSSEQLIGFIFNNEKLNFFARTQLEAEKFAEQKIKNEIKNTSFINYKEIKKKEEEKEPGCYFLKNEKGIYFYELIKGWVNNYDVIIHKIEYTKLTRVNVWADYSFSHSRYHPNPVNQEKLKKLAQEIEEKLKNKKQNS
jgi:hypothetical protein